jgi:hypothetical protein|tara:strand:- start:98 stop:823 length:726 start_codon:yes stop_codon:yes gene_type:complete
MLGVLTDNGKVNYISLDNFISIDKMKYFDTYFEKQFKKFCNELPRIIERNEWAYHQYEENRSKDFIFNNLMSTWYDHNISREDGWRLLKTYVPEFIDYLFDNVVDYMQGMLIRCELQGGPMKFHRDWGPDTNGDLGLSPTEKEARELQETWIWFRFSDTKKLYISELDGKDDISKRIPVKPYGAVFNGLDYHGCYEDSYGFSVRISGGLKKNIISDKNIDITTWKDWYPPTEYWKTEALTI